MVGNVPLAPALDDLTIANFDDFDAGDGSELTGRPQAQKLGLIRARGRPTDCDLRILCIDDQVLNPCAEIREGAGELCQTSGKPSLAGERSADEQSSNSAECSRSKSCQS